MSLLSDKDIAMRSDQESAGLRLLLVALAGAVLFHGGLLPFTHGNTYDAFIHMFFGDSYNRSWFDVWEPRWYTGFATTSYPPGTHMAIGALQNFIPLRAAFVVVQLTGLLLLTIGVYRFSLLWVEPRAGGYAAIALVLSSSISETIHLFGQLPTIFSLGVFLNGLPYVYRWIVFGRLRDFAIAVLFSAATTAAHHVTTIFGGALFVLPLGLQALRAVLEHQPAKGFWRKLGRLLKPLGRGTLLAVFMLSAILITVFPYWHWSINDPITQVPIPHGSRENFLERLDLGFVFFLLPWGLSGLFLPYAFYKTITSRLWPLGMSVMLCFILGTGGTTPISRAILRGAFDILTLDRFTFWASILILPFLGHMFDGLLHGRSGQVLRQALGHGVQRVLVGGIFLGMTLIAVFAAILPTIKPTQPDFIDPTPIVQFLGEDEHDRWRYLTLGFGDQFAYMSAQTEALSVDGNYHSARRLPDLTRFSVERLENAKYLGVPGLGSLKQFLVNADDYHLKYVFANDAFYDPILHFTGWTRLNKLANGITVWEKPDIRPLPIMQPRRDIPILHMMMWGILPPLALLSAASVFILSALRRNFGALPGETRPHIERKRDFANPKRVRLIVIALAIIAATGAGVVGWSTYKKLSRPAPAETVIETYFDHLDFRRFEAAYALLDPETRPDFEKTMFNWRWRGGLIASYGKLTDISAKSDTVTPQLIDWSITLDWLTSLDTRQEHLALRTVKRGDNWYIAPTSLRPSQAPARFQRTREVGWKVTGRRQPRPETDLHRDILDRPKLSAGPARLIKFGDRYSLVGSLRNIDIDPAHLSVFATLRGGDQDMVRQSAADVLGQRLLPAEATGYRIEFEGVLSLSDVEASGGFDPTMFIPPELPHIPEGAQLEARGLVTGRDLYRDVALNNLVIQPSTDGPRITGLAVNTGTQTASIIRIVALALDDTGMPLWAESGYVDTNIYPGQSAPFGMQLPRASDLEIVSDVTASDVSINGASNASAIAPHIPATALPMPDGSGYAALQLHVSVMTYDPLF